MLIAIIAPGSRGDVEPYLALGQGLKQAGHQARLVTHGDFEQYVRSCGVEFWPITGNVQEIVQSQDMRELLERGNFLSIMVQMAKEARRSTLTIAKDGLAACQGADLIIAGIGGIFIGAGIAEKLGIPLMQAYYIPLTPTQAFPSFLAPNLPRGLGGAANWLSHQAARQLMWQGFHSADRAARRDVFGIPPAPVFGPYTSASTQHTPVLYGFSPSVISKPPDWSRDTHITGYWFLNPPSEWYPPETLVDFLRSGPPPVYIGFGSMSNREPEKIARVILQALAQAKQRAILLSGWGGLQAGDLPETVLMVDSVPFSWLFPRLAAVVHHGGAGTTAAGLRAGVPSVIIPFFGDQPFWGQNIVRLGVGPKPIPRAKLNADNLAQAIKTAVTDQAMRQRAADLGARIRDENGVAEAVSIITDFFKTG